MSARFRRQSTRSSLNIASVPRFQSVSQLLDRSDVVYVLAAFAKKVTRASMRIVVLCFPPAFLVDQSAQNASAMKSQTLSPWLTLLAPCKLGSRNIASTPSFSLSSSSFLQPTRERKREREKARLNFASEELRRVRRKMDLGPKAHYS